MKRFTSFSIRFLLTAGLATASLMTTGGCTDALTYAKESRATGLDLYNQGNYTDAAGAFTNAIRQDPTDYRSHCYLADCYAKDKAYNQAIEQYQTCLQIMPLSLDGKLNTPFRLKVLDGLADALASSGDPQAEADAVAQGATSPEKFFLLAKVQRRLGDADAATESYRQAALLAPDDFDIAKEYSLYLVKLQDIQHADPELRHAYTLNDHDDQINDALRQIGVIPGPGLKPEADLNHPLIPEGPIPPVDWSKIPVPNPFKSSNSDAASSAGSAGTTSSTIDTTAGPRD